MHIQILTVGSRGDIEPLIPLGAALVAKGHKVRLVANSEGRAASERAGVPFGDLGFSVSAMLLFALGRYPDLGKVAPRA